MNNRIEKPYVIEEQMLVEINPEAVYIDISEERLKGYSLDALCSNCKLESIKLPRVSVPAKFFEHAYYLQEVFFFFFKDEFFSDTEISPFGDNLSFKLQTSDGTHFVEFYNCKSEDGFGEEYRLFLDSHTI